MTYSKLDAVKKRRTYSRMLGEIRHALNEALTEEQAKHGLTMAEISRALGHRHKSTVSRWFSGESNMTLETLSDLATALDRPVKVELPSRHPALGGNYHHGDEVAETPKLTVVMAAPRASGSSTATVSVASLGDTKTAFIGPS